MVFFIPWRGVAEESGAAHVGLGGAMLLDPLEPAGRRFANFVFAEFPVSERTSHGVDAANTPDRKPR